MKNQWDVHNPGGSLRVVVTKALPGQRWLDILTGAGCTVEVCTSESILTADQIEEAIGGNCDGIIGQLTETWGDRLFSALAQAGGAVYSNYAVGYNNVDVAAATQHGILVGNTPGVLTETTAEMAAALTLSTARRIVEADRFQRAGLYRGWLPTMFLGHRLYGKTVGVIGCGRIGTAYGRIMVEGFKMNLVYVDPRTNDSLEAFVDGYAGLLTDQGEPPVTATRIDTIEELLSVSDVVSLHTLLNDETHHLINEARLAMMKHDAILINTSRGPVVDEVALVNHCRAHPEFRAGLDVFEDEPAMKPGLAELDNVTIVPHIASATKWTREGMATLAAANVSATLLGQPPWTGESISPFLAGDVPPFAPSIVNAPKGTGPNR